MLDKTALQHYQSLAFQITKNYSIHFCVNFGRFNIGFTICIEKMAAIGFVGIGCTDKGTGCKIIEHIIALGPIQILLKTIIYPKN